MVKNVMWLVDRVSSSSSLSPISRCRGSYASEESEIHCMGCSQLVSAPMEGAGANHNMKQPQDASSWPKLKSRICEHRHKLQNLALGYTAWWENIPQIHSWFWYKHNQIIKVLPTERRKWPLYSGTPFYLPLHANNCMLKIWEKNTKRNIIFQQKHVPSD